MWRSCPPDPFTTRVVKPKRVGPQVTKNDDQNETEIEPFMTLEEFGNTATAKANAASWERTTNPTALNTTTREEYFGLLADYNAKRTAEEGLEASL